MKLHWSTYVVYEGIDLVDLGDLADLVYGDLVQMVHVIKSQKHFFYNFFYHPTVGTTELFLNPASLSF